MLIHEVINRLWGDIEHNATLVALVTVLVLTLLSLAAFGLVNACVWVRDWWRAGRLPERRIAEAMAKADWYAWEKQLANAHQPPDPDGSP
jgi:hypothetical protein